jgi:hypothetical protein
MTMTSNFKSYQPAMTILTATNPSMKQTVATMTQTPNPTAMNQITITPKKQTKEQMIIRSLFMKNDLRVWQGMIFILTGESKQAKYKPIHDLGKGSWGKIDYLVNHLGYSLHHVAEWPEYIPPRYSVLLELDDEQSN